MTFLIIPQLLELLTPGNVHMHADQSVNGLLKTDEYKALQALAPKFASKLELAWEGDASDWKRTKGKNFEPLFPQLATKKAFEKFEPGVKLDMAHEKHLQMLARLHSYSFPQPMAVKVDKSPWASERWVRESQETTLTYTQLALLKQLREDLKLLS